MSRRRSGGSAARLEQARAEAERIARAHARRRRLLVAGAAGLLLALVVVAVLILRDAAQQSYLDDVERRPVGSDTSGGIPVGSGGTPGRGERLDVYLDLRSEEAVAFWRAQQGDLEQLRADGDVALWLHPVAFVDGGVNGASTRPAEAIAVVADDQPADLAAFVDAVVAARAGGSGLNDPDLVEIADEVGIATDVSARFTDALFDTWVEAATQQAVREGVERAPTVLLDGEALDADWDEPGTLAAAVADAPVR